jgi:hypothetical protein
MFEDGVEVDVVVGALRDALVYSTAGSSRDACLPANFCPLLLGGRTVPRVPLFVRDASMIHISSHGDEDACIRTSWPINKSSSLL